MNTEHSGLKPMLCWTSLSLALPDEANLRLFTPHYSIGFYSAADLASGSIPEISTAAGICFDCDSPEAPELSLISEVKRRHPSIPVLLLATELTAPTVTWALRSRVFDCLSKPLNATEAVGCIERLKAARMARRGQNSRPHITGVPTVPAFGHPAARGKGSIPWAMLEIKRRLAARPSETEMAALCRLSPSSFSRSFRREAGMTFQRFLATSRLELACRLLADSELSIGEIGTRVGFDDPTYFARFFRREAGLTPSDYRLGARDARRVG